jgi:3-hydroxyacyl-[acyl-carrier-protein] dehydratase
MTNSFSPDINEILEQIPHRYPFLLVDRILECVGGEKVVGIKNVTYNEWFFSGHFPNQPIMPGVLILEAMAQCTGVLIYATLNRRPLIECYLVGIDNARFKSIVTPGDQLKMTLRIVRRVKDVWKLTGRAEVDDRLVAESDFLCHCMQKDPES